MAVTQRTSSLLPIRRGLVDHLLAQEVKLSKRADRPPTMYAGPKAYRPRPSPYSDELILEVRRLREQRGMSAAAIAARMTARGYPLKPGTVTSMISYATRGHLIPAANADSYLPDRASQTQ
jgi:hypothetical protein